MPRAQPDTEEAETQKPQRKAETIEKKKTPEDSGVFLRLLRLLCLCFLCIWLFQALVTSAA